MATTQGKARAMPMAGVRAYQRGLDLPNRSVDETAGQRAYALAEAADEADDQPGLGVVEAEGADEIGRHELAAAIARERNQSDCRRRC